MHFAKKKPFISLYTKKGEVFHHSMTRFVEVKNDIEIMSSGDLKVIYIEKEKENDFFGLYVKDKIIIYEIDNEISEEPRDIKESFKIDFSNTGGVNDLKLYHSMIIGSSNKGVFLCSEVSQCSNPFNL